MLFLNNLTFIKIDSFGNEIHFFDIIQFHTFHRVMYVSKHRFTHNRCKVNLLEIMNIVQK
jgi:hypothetical protein